MEAQEPSQYLSHEKRTYEKRADQGDIIPWNISLETIDGKTHYLSEWRGYVLLIVNTATKCGFASQIDELEELYNKYKEKKFIVLAFPSNDFLNQEPGTNQEIEQRCRLAHTISFPLFARISVKGPSIHPLYTWITDKSIHGKRGGSIMWNFTKCIIDREGRLVERFSPMTSPTSNRFEELIESLVMDSEKSTKDQEVSNA